MKSKKIGHGRWVLGDCLEAMAKLPDNSVDMILCDPPYGTTRNKWDIVIPLDLMWQEYKRVIKPNGAIVLFGHHIFTAKVIVSNPEWFKYKIVWEKYKSTNFLNARKQPLRKHEDVMVFYNKQPVYNPQMVKGEPYNKGLCGASGNNYNEAAPKKRINKTGDRFPSDVVRIYENINYITIHPTQKPASLFEYLIKTYSNEGDIVLDNCAGSGTTAIACENTKRRWICIEKDKDYTIKACKRIREHLNAI